MKHIFSFIFTILLCSLCDAQQNCPGIDIVQYSGQTYHTVQIGSQCWLKENLNAGIMINGSSEQTNNGTIEKYCYGNDQVNCKKYGGLYQWDEAMQYVTTQGIKGICPNGWHIPTDEEFQTLTAAVNGDGNRLKAVGQGTGGGAGINTSGFSALLAGYRSHYGYFYPLGSTTYFWSSKKGDAAYAYGMTPGYDDSNIYFGQDFKVYGFSVRCIKDK
jgi:uncharacterized protein (TIGR02145 family)